MKQLVYSAVFCKCCGTTIQSLHTHDYKICGCENNAMVDGGLDYHRCGAHDMKMIQSIMVHDDEPFDKVRQYMFRGGHGKDMKGIFRITRLFEMTDGHLKALLEYGCAEWQKKLVNAEINYRKEKRIKVND